MIQPTLRDADDIGFISFKSSPETSPGPIDVSRLEAWLDSFSHKAVLVHITGCDCAGYDEVINLFMKAQVPLAALIEQDSFDHEFELALACHFRFASISARIGFPGKNAPSVQPSALVGQNLCRTGRERLSELTASSIVIGSREAAVCKLVDAVVPDTALEKTALDFVRSLTAKRSPPLIRSVLRSVTNSRILSRDLALKNESDLFYKLALIDDAAINRPRP
jgi:enoyl-CoA hydratase/carnithine racemase